MTKKDLINLLSQYSDDTIIQVWSFSGPRSATALEVAAFQPREVCEGHVFEPRLSLLPVVK